MEQTVQNERPAPLKGAGIVALTVLVLLAGSRLFGWLGRWIGGAAPLCFIVYGALVALPLSGVPAGVPPEQPVKSARTKTRASSRLTIRFIFFAVLLLLF